MNTFFVSLRMQRCEFVFLFACMYEHMLDIYIYIYVYIVVHTEQGGWGGLWQASAGHTRHA